MKFESATPVLFVRDVGRAAAFYRDKLGFAIDFRHGEPPLHADKKKLEHVQKATQAEIERYRGYNSAKEVISNFHRDLSSEPAKKVHRELKSLHLPAIGDIRDEFDKKAEQHGVSASH